MKYSDMVVEISDLNDPEKREDGNWWRRFNVRVLSSPAGEMSPEEKVPRDYDVKGLNNMLGKFDRRELDRHGLFNLGQLLGDLLLPKAQNGNGLSMQGMFLMSLELMGQDEGLRLRLRLPPDLSNLPWECLYVDRPGMELGMPGFISLNRKVTIVRHEVLRKPVRSVRLDGDIRVVAAFASQETEDEDKLKLEQEERNLKEALKDRTEIKATFLQGATLSDVLKTIPSTGVFHFAGHSKCPQEAGPLPFTTRGLGKLDFADQSVEAERLAANLQSNGVRLVVLNSCESGKGGGVNFWGGIAAALVRCDVPAVVANQYKILDECAIEFSRHFYHALLGGLPIEEAVVAGRLGAYNADPNGRDWGVPALYLRTADGQLFEGARNKDVRGTARREVENFIGKHSVNIIQQNVKVVTHNPKFGDWNIKASSVPDTERCPTPPSKSEVASGESSQKEPSFTSEGIYNPAEIVGTDQDDSISCKNRMKLIDEALKPVLVKLIAELPKDDLPLAFQRIVDLSYELARDCEANVDLIEEMVQGLVVRAPGVMPELKDLFTRDEFKSLAPSEVLSDSTKKSSPSSQGPPD